MIRYPFRQFVWVWRFRSMFVHRWAECIYSTILVRYWTKKFPFYLIWRWILMLCSLARVGKDEILMPTTRLIENKFKSVAGVLVGHGDYNPKTRMIPTKEWVAKSVSVWTIKIYFKTFFQKYAWAEFRYLHTEVMHARKSDTPV